VGNQNGGRRVVAVGGIVARWKKVGNQNHAHGGCV